MIRSLITNFYGHLSEEFVALIKDGHFTKPPLFPHPVDVTEGLIENAITLAMKEIGRGEGEGDNRGPDIRRYCAPMTDGYAWCAAFQGYVYQGAAELLGVEMPFQRSLSARVLVNNMAMVGREITLAEARPGDLVLFPRPGGNHVGMYLSHATGLIQTLDGNSGPFVRKVERDLKTHPPKKIATLRRAP